MNNKQPNITNPPLLGGASLFASHTSVASEWSMVQPCRRLPLAAPLGPRRRRPQCFRCGEWGHVSGRCRNAVTCSIYSGLGHSSWSRRRRAAAPLPPRRSPHHVPAISHAPPCSTFHFTPLPPSSSTRHTSASTRRTSVHPNPPNQPQLSSSPDPGSGSANLQPPPIAPLQHSPDPPLLPLPPRPYLCSAAVTLTPEMLADLCYLRSMVVLSVVGGIRCPLVPLRNFFTASGRDCGLG